MNDLSVLYSKIILTGFISGTVANSFGDIAVEGMPSEDVLNYHFHKRKILKKFAQSPYPDYDDFDFVNIDQSSNVLASMLTSGWSEPYNDTINIQKCKYFVDNHEIGTEWSKSYKPYNHSIIYDCCMLIINITLKQIIHCKIICVFLQ